MYSFKIRDSLHLTKTVHIHNYSDVKKKIQELTKELNEFIHRYKFSCKVSCYKVRMTINLD